MSSRLLDMGDVLSLLEKAEKVISETEAKDAAEKMRKADFSLEDFRDQLKMVSRMGPLSGLLKMLPGMGALKEQLEQVDTEKELSRVNAILNSMTPGERKQPDILNGSRRARIAKGSGTEVAEVNGLVKRFLEARKMMKQMSKMAGMFKGGAPNSGMGQMPNFGGRPRGGKGFGRKF
jgi:signal recognition particle subunit SRP54